MASGSPAWGWHRLGRSWAERLVRDAGIGPGHLVLDIGAGDGSLTAPLVAAGARVIAFELHPHRAADLRRRFVTDDVRVVQADARDLRLPRRPFRVVANPPWAITTPLLRRLVHRASRLERADLVVQRAAALRWSTLEVPGFVISVGPTIPRRAFRPPPAFDGARLTIERCATVAARRRGRR